MRPSTIAASLFAITVHAPVWACTLCHSRVAEDVRAAVLGPELWTDLGLVLMPVPALAGAVLLVRKLLP